MCIQLKRDVTPAIPGRRKYAVNIGLRRLGLRKHRRLPTAGDLMSQNR
jgi:hypothetical protein